VEATRVFEAVGLTILRTTVDATGVSHTADGYHGAVSLA
jgi:hypothetical protein